MQGHHNLQPHPGYHPPSERYIEPWFHSKFALLPRAVLHGIRMINPFEMPVRAAYDEALIQFIKDLPAYVAEVSAFTPEGYATLARSVSWVYEDGRSGTATATVSSSGSGWVSKSVKEWTMVHHMRSESRKYNLNLVPKEEYLGIPREREDKLRNEFMAEVDGELFNGCSTSNTSNNLS